MVTNPLPHVLAVMITGKSPERIPLARAAVRSFLAQSYPGKHLLIVNDGDQRVLLIGEDGPMTEMRIERQSSLGSLRNCALDYAQQHFPDSLILQWDDDDWSHPTRMFKQVERLKPDLREPQAVTLLRQVRYDFKANVAYEVEYRDKGETGPTQWGIPGTILHTPCDFRYEPVGKHEDSRFLKLFPHVHVLDNDPHLYLRFSHGANTWSARHIMRAHAAQRDFWDVSPRSAHQLKQTLPEYGIAEETLQHARIELKPFRPRQTRFQ